MKTFDEALAIVVPRLEPGGISLKQRWRAKMLQQSFSDDIQASSVIMPLAVQFIEELVLAAEAGDFPAEFLPVQIFLNGLKTGVAIGVVMEKPETD